MDDTTAHWTADLHVTERSAGFFGGSDGHAFAIIDFAAIADTIPAAVESPENRIDFIAVSLSVVAE